MLRIKKLILVLLICLSLSACAKFNGNLSVNSDGSIGLNGELLISKQVLTAQGIEAQNLIKGINSEIAAHFTTETIEKTIDGVDYAGITFETVEAFKDDLISITTKDNKTTLIIEKNFLTKLGINLDSFENSDEGVDLLKNLGMELKLNIKMPGSIISANYGNVLMQTVSIDLIQNLDSLFIVVSYADNTLVYSFIALAVILLLLIISLIVIRWHLRKKKHQSSNKHHH